jgi:hypothetical protein
VAQLYQSRFGRDFSAVRVHSDATAQRYNKAVQAYAFTYGNHIWLGAGLRAQPSHILAHELAHVVQQTQPASVKAPPGQPELSPSTQGVQRFTPYWMPEKFKVVGTESHALILPEIGRKNKIFTEAPVPNAGSMGVAPGGEKAGGIADLYQASTTVGVYFEGHNLPRRLKSNARLEYKGGPYPHKEKSAPQVDETRERVNQIGWKRFELKKGVSFPYSLPTK